MATGWPTDAELADHLGLAPGDDAGRVTSANAAAQACGVYYGLDPDAGATDADVYESILQVGAWVYGIRNRPEGLDSLNPVASPYIRRTAISIILARTGMPVA
jgi:hypothetical protein